MQHFWDMVSIEVICKKKTSWIRGSIQKQLVSVAKNQSYSNINVRLNIWVLVVDGMQLQMGC